MSGTCPQSLTCMSVCGPLKLAFVITLQRQAREGAAPSFLPYLAVSFADNDIMGRRDHRSSGNPIFAGALLDVPQFYWLEWFGSCGAWFLDKSDQLSDDAVRCAVSAFGLMCLDLLQLFLGGDRVR